MAITECPRCGDALKGHEKFCPNCKKIITQDFAGIIEKPVNCPICKIPLYKANLGGHEVLHCAECGGTALKREIVMKISPLDKKQLDISPEEHDHRTPLFFEKREKPPFLICPFCGKKMENKKLGPMQTDICEKCRAVFLEGERIKHLNEIIGPFKMMAMKEKDGEGGRRSRR